jgi:ketosteroid isomerase-like protein
MNCLRVLRMERDSPRGILHAMSQAKVEIVRRAFAAFDSGRLERVRDLVTDDLLVYGHCAGVTSAPSRARSAGQKRLGRQARTAVA